LIAAFIAVSVSFFIAPLWGITGASLGHQQRRVIVTQGETP
jgi:hypothetical protein